MAGLEYSCVPARFAPEYNFRLGPDALEWRSGRRQGSVAYADVASLDICKERFLGSSATYWRCIVRPASGARIRIGAASRSGWRGVEDRTAAYMPFIKEFEARVAAANPNRIVATGPTPLGRIEEGAGRAAIHVLHAIGRIAPDRCADFAAFLLRRLGPRLRGHRTARAQLAAAFPEKSAAEIEAILGGMWDNLARSVIEYAVLDRLWDHDLVHAHDGRIVVDQASIERWARVRDDPRPMLGFAAHLANWELSAIAMSVHGREAVIPMRAPKVRALADELIRIRTKSGLHADRERRPRRCPHQGGACARRLRRHAGRPVSSRWR